MGGGHHEVTQHSISQTNRWYSLRGQSITIEPKSNCIFDVELSVSNTWGYAGGSYSLAINLPDGLSSVANIFAYGSRGDTIGRQMVSRLVAAGAKAGQSYSFQYTLDNGGGSSDPMWIVREIAV